MLLFICLFYAYHYLYLHCISLYWMWCNWRSFQLQKRSYKTFPNKQRSEDQMTYETYVYSTKNTYDQFYNLLLYFLCIPNQKIHHLSPLFFLYEPFCFLHGHKQYSIQYTDIRLFKTSI